MDKKFIFGLTALAVLAAAVFFLPGILSEKIEAKEFIGQLIEVKSNSIIIEGAYNISSFQDSDQNNFQPELKKVEVLVDSKTKFSKTLLYLPSAQDLEKTGGKYDPSGLKRGSAEGSLEDLKIMEGGVSITAKSESNVYNRSRFFASEIQYIEAIYP